MIRRVYRGGKSKTTVGRICAECVDKRTEDAQRVARKVYAAKKRAEYRANEG